MNDLKNRGDKPAATISAAEFDRKVEAGENVDEYFDWDNGVVVEPGELSPGQIQSMVAMFSELSPEQQLLLMQTMLDASPGLEASLNISIPFPLLWAVAREAMALHLSRETFIKSLIAQHFEKKGAVG